MFQSITAEHHDHHLSEQQKGTLSDITKRCQLLLGEIRKKLDYYAEFDGTKNFRGAVQLVWKRFLWDETEVTEFREQISQRVKDLTLLLAHLNWQGIQDTKDLTISNRKGVEQIVQHVNEKDRLDLMKWLSPINSAAKQADTLKLRDKSTGQWFLETDEFSNWFNQAQNQRERRTLFCQGAPGTGKTLMISTVIDELRRRIRNDSTIRLAYFYFNYRAEFTIEEILANLLKQLILDAMVPYRLKSLYESHRKHETHLTLEEILELLESTISESSKVFIVIDALDECQLPHIHQQELLARISEFQDIHNLGFLATSRDNPDISDMFPNCPRLRVEAKDTDIKAFLETSLNHFRCVKESPDLREEILAAIINAADGMFLLASLQLGSLEKLSPDEVRAQLNNLPPGLDEAYSETMERIKSQSHENVRKAKQVLLWIACATRPLSPHEVQHGIAVNVGESKLGKGKLTNIDDLVSLCAGLVRVDEQTDVIRLAHYTAQKYLEDKRERYFSDAHSQIAHKCLAYLYLDSFQTEPPESRREYLARQKQYPLYAYSAENWGYHARQAYASVEGVVKIFLHNHLALKNSLQVLRGDRLFPIYKNTILSKFSALHSAAWFGLDECILDLLTDKSVIDDIDDDGQTALHWATRNEQISTVELLLQHGSSLNLVDKEGKGAIHHAINKGEARLLRVIGDNGANLELADNRGQTPLLNAVETMAVEATQILLEMGAEVGALNLMKQNVLHLAALGGRDDALQVITLLFSHHDYPGPGVSDLDNMTPLHYAVAKGHQKLAKLLLQNGADINLGIHRNCAGYPMGNHHTTECTLKASQGKPSCDHNTWGLTPLHFAALAGSSTMTKFLLSEGADVNARCQYGDTPLHLTLRKAVLDLDRTPPSSPLDFVCGSIPRIQDAWSDNRWKIECLKDLIDDHESEEVAEIYDRISEERMKVLSSIVTHPDIDVNLGNLNQETPMHLITIDQHDSIAVFSELAKKSPRTCIRNMQGQTPLHIACLKGDEKIARQFLRLDSSSAFECDLQGNNPLHCAIRSENKKLVKALLAHFDKQGRSACTEVDDKGNNLLHFYLEEPLCFPRMVRFLMGYGVNVNLLNAEGDSPLSIYLQSSHLGNKKEMCQLLIRKGADPLWRNSLGENLAHVHMHSFVEDCEVFRILKHSGVDIFSKDHSNKSILHHAAIHGSLGEQVVAALHDYHGSDLYQPDIDGMTPLIYAEKRASEQIEDENFAREGSRITLEFLERWSETYWNPRTRSERYA
ncbi:hypothetical protein DTO013E5_9989 [Penicillium roqueforti]|nr:hypothetical protein DTO012A1_10006 [Penicillium roqueforti]KAI2737262.1 hypothetical protein DTO013F2_9802 [Penicillium roqueforti]KAI3132495.1 hypothetical protein CBS147325_8721 [Penicillium roqueforti]KAI3148792.1 hypothetical protein DTO046C5_9820 [Penicillium roqueforti]KAI3188048.1 hypothetical protein CBS147311_10120 [Penicillium roqueforti]